MRFRNSAPLALLITLLGPVPVCLADGGCEKHELGDGRPFVKRAEAAEKGGNFEGALQELKRMPACASNVNHTQISEWRTRLNRRQGEVEEKRGNFETAARWYQEAMAEDDLVRVMDRWGKSASRDREVFGRVFGFFEHNHPDAARLKEYRQLAGRNIDELLSREDKTFPRMEESLGLLKEASRWSGYTENAGKKINDRAVLRGDDLAKDETPVSFQHALVYYDFAEATDRMTRLRRRALELAEAHEKKGDSLAAAHYYSIGGRNDKSKALAKQNLAKERKDESARKSRFQQDQKALEKELGF